MRTHAPTHKHMRACVHAHTQTRTRTHTKARTHAHARTHTRTHVRLRQDIDDTTTVIALRSAVHAAAPERRGTVRADLGLSGFVMSVSAYSQHTVVLPDYII